MRTVFWKDNQVQMIDQRLLPGEFVIACFATVDAVARSIREMYVRGAPAIGATGAYGMVVAAQTSGAADAAGLLQELAAAKVLLDQARPTAVNLSWATSRLLHVAQEEAAHGATLAGMRAALLHEAETLADEDIELNRRMGFHGAEVIVDGANILHHCNTGTLAAVDFGTALGVMVLSSAPPCMDRIFPSARAT